MAEPIAVIKQGQLKGLIDTDLNEDKYYKFLGVPYAKPPVGPLRFKAPQPAESWTGIRDATKEGNQCLAQDVFTFKPTGSEDCLYLNIFTKEMPKPGLDKKPVMVNIHGGGFTIGSGSEQAMGAKNLMIQDIVLVSINYRVGALGFLSSDDLSLEVPGNAGLKDQTFSLKWVQENIASFNGDPNNVTIFGLSAGGASINFQILSPTAQGLFHKAIAQSGAALNPWAWGQKNAIQLVEKLGKKVSTDKDALDILMNVTAEDLLLASLKIPDALMRTHIRRPFGPVIEKPNPTAFLTENPSDLLASGKFIQVPLIEGFCSNEGLMCEVKSMSDIIDPRPKEMGVIWNLGVKENSQQYSKLKALIYDFYFKNGETDDAIQEIVSDVGFNIGIIETTKLAAKSSRNPVYLYVFTYDTTISNMALGVFDKTIDKHRKYKGVTHGAEMQYLFNSPMLESSGLLEDLDPKEKEEINIGIKKVTKIWADFARTGRPHEQWEPVTNANELKYFDINKEPELKVKPFAERVAFWEKVFQEVPKLDARVHEKPSS